MPTRTLADLTLGYQSDALPQPVRTMAVRCIFDAVACGLAGLRESTYRMVAAEVTDQGGRPEATLFGAGVRLPAMQAVLANGTAAHALDYDDVNMAIMGHPSTVLTPTVLAIAEATGASGRDVVAAFVAGYEVMCRVGAMMSPGHYDRGFHATATTGAVGAAAAAAHLLKLSPQQTASALALGATQASGLKALFGTMGKPLHAGIAARNGVLAARLAARGFDAGHDALEHRQGMVRAMSDDFHPEEAAKPATHFYILENLFKYHAACYGTHGALESANRLRSEHALQPGSIAKAVVFANPASDKYCNIPAPASSNEGKFSLRLNTAFALMGVNTARLDAYDEARVRSPEAVALRDRVEVRFDPALQMMQARVEVETAAGARYATMHDAGEPEKDFAVQARRVQAKFEALVEPVLGAERALRLKTLLLGLEELPGVRPLAQAWDGAPGS